MSRKTRSTYANQVSLTHNGFEVFLDFYKNIPASPDDPEMKERVSSVILSLPIAFSLYKILEKSIIDSGAVEEIEGAVGGQENENR